MVGSIVNTGLRDLLRMTLFASRKCKTVNLIVRARDLCKLKICIKSAYTWACTRAFYILIHTRVSSRERDNISSTMFRFGVRADDHLGPTTYNLICSTRVQSTV